MSKVLAVLTATLALGAVGAPHTERPTAKPVQVATMCMKTGEETSGMNKICYYDCLGSQAAITISAVALCPLSINR